MAIVKMKKLRLMAVRNQKEELLKQLMIFGCVELREPENDGLAPELSHIIIFIIDIFAVEIDISLCCLNKAIQMLDQG